MQESKTGLTLIVRGFTRGCSAPIQYMDRRGKSE